MKTILSFNLSSLSECIFLRRLNRFTVLVESNGTMLEAHLNNTGRLLNVLKPGVKGFLVETKSGRLGYRLLGVYVDGGVAVLDTLTQEKAFARAVEEGLIPWLKDCSVAGRNKRISDIIVDYQLECGGREVYVELKSAILDLNGYAGYPDAPSERGRRHIRVLGDLASKGFKTMVVFVASIPGAKGFRLYCREDKLIGRTAWEALSKGLLFKSISIYFDPISLSIMLEDPDLHVDLWSECSDI